MPPSLTRVTPGYVNAAASFATQLSLENLGSRATDHALTIVRDTLGCIIAGGALPEIKGLRREALHLGGGGGASAVGVEGRLAPQAAAMINAAAGVSLELDEGCQFSTNHPSVHILPAAFAVAEANGNSGREFLEAFIAGYEVAC